MAAAVRAVKDGNMCCNKAATRWEIPEATLRRYLKKNDTARALCSTVANLVL